MDSSGKNIKGLGFIYAHTRYTFISIHIDTHKHRSSCKEDAVGGHGRWADEKR